MKVSLQIKALFIALRSDFAVKIACPYNAPPLIYDSLEQYFPVLFGHRTPCHSKHLCRTLNKILIYKAKKSEPQKNEDKNKYYRRI
jgi:hypothetical protein